ncbi:MAG: hypothetical protein AB7E55_12625 [Pigmentiphaga sp.]
MSKYAWVGSTFIAIAIVFSGLSHAGSVTYPDEYGRHIRQSGLIQTMKDQFGDRIDLNSGGLEIVQTDIVLPGIGPGVRVGRRYRPGDAYGGEGLFRYWDIDLPHIHGTFAAFTGWPGWGAPAARCSQFTAPPDVVVQGGSFSADEYWSGTFLYMPEGGEQELLERANAPAPNDGKAYPVVTRAGSVMRCVPLAPTSESGRSGEGFEVVATDGTVYTLNQYVSRYERPMSKPYPDPLFPVTGAGKSRTSAFVMFENGESQNNQDLGVGGGPQLSVGYNLMRKEILLYPTKVTDRFGNSVRYIWSAVNPWQLLRIEADDGRHLDFTYLSATDMRVSKITDGNRTWTYTYTSDLGWTDSPDTLTLPDGSVWAYRLARLSLASPRPYGVSCDEIGGLNPTVYTGSITSPSGATMVIAMKSVLFGRSGVYRECMHLLDNQEYAIEPYLFNGFAVISKTITGPALPAAGLTWSYSYGPPNNCWLNVNGGISGGTVCTASSPSTRMVSVTDPGGSVTRYTFGNRYKFNEGLLLKTEYGWNGTDALRTVTIDYADPEAMPYASSNGRSLRHMGDYDITGFLRPQRQVTVAQQGRTFTWQVAADCSGIPYCFDALARPTKTIKASTP